MGRLLAALAGATVALACAGPADADSGFLALGDFGVGGAFERRVGAAVSEYEAAHPVDALVTLGDNDYTERPRAFRRNWRDAFGWLASAGVAPYGTLGNHDVRVDGGRYEFEALGMPGRFYRRRLVDVELFLLDSNSVGKRQTAWLARRLAASSAAWKVAVFHHPAFTCGAYRGDPRVLRRWVPLFERHGLDLVLSGHDHNYQRFRARNGVRYVVHGGGGPRLYAIERCPSGYPARRRALAAHGFLHVQATSTRLVVKALDLDGEVLDRGVLRSIPPAGIFKAWL